MSKVVAIILAGGRGARFGSSVPKQFIKLAGKLIIEHTVETFQTSPHIDEIIIVSPQGFTDYIWNLAETNHWTKLSKVILGGDERFDSTWSALEAMAAYPADTKVMFHDAARPLVSHEILRQCAHALSTVNAVDVVIPSSDTIVKVDDKGNIADIPVRASLRRGQTPQAFNLSTIRKAYEKSFETGQKKFTCDCGVVRSMLPEEAIATVAGAESNLKITESTDLFLAEKLIQIRSMTANSDAPGFDRLNGKTVVIFGGSYGIGQAIATICTDNGAKVFALSRSTGGVDVKDREAIETYLAATEKEAGKIDYIVNTAGILIKKPLNTMSGDEIQNILDVNLKGAVNVAYAAMPYLRKTRGCLLNFTSSSYTRGRAFYALYSATKAAVVNLTQALADEWAGEGIRVNCINPERTDTPMRRSNFGVEPAGTLLTAEQVATASIATLVSTHTGVTVDVRNV